MQAREDVEDPVDVPSVQADALASHARSVFCAVAPADDLDQRTPPARRAATIATVRVASRRTSDRRATSLGDLVFDHYSVESGPIVVVDALLGSTGAATGAGLSVQPRHPPAARHGSGVRTTLALVKRHSAPLSTFVNMSEDIAAVRAGKP